MNAETRRIRERDRIDRKAGSLTGAERERVHAELGGLREQLRERALMFDVLARMQTGDYPRRKKKARG